MFLEDFSIIPPEKRAKSSKISFKCDVCGKISQKTIYWYFAHKDDEIQRCPACTARFNGAKSIKSKWKGKHNNPTFVSYWMSQGYTKEEAKLKIRQLYIKWSLDYWLYHGYNENEAKIKQREYANLRNPAKEEYWLNKGFSEEEAKEKIKEHHKKVSEVAQNSNYDRKRSSRFSTVFWVERGYSEEEARNKVLEIEHEIHRTRKKGKYTKVKLTEKQLAWASYKAKQLVKSGFSPIHKEYWIKRGYNEEDAKIEAYKVRSNNNAVCSKLETKFLDTLESVLNIKFERNHYLTINGSGVIPDGKYGKYIIEFNGTNPHCDPRFYSENDINGFGCIATDIWLKDAKKIDKYRSKDYTVFIVWEHDANKHTNEICKMIKETMENEVSIKGNVWDSSRFFN